MKGKHLVFLILGILFLDQAVKIYIKTHFYLNEEVHVLGTWFNLHFIENDGMAWGLKFGGSFGKIFLTLFRLVAVIFGVFYLRHIVKKGFHKGFIICAGLIFTGALGNLIDSMFYGMIFDRGMIFDHTLQRAIGYEGLATFSSQGYSSFLHGNVVDMLYFPMIKGHFPDWVPFWGGEDFTFFSPIFNIADASISIGVIALLIWQNKFFPKKKKEEPQMQEVSGN